MGQNCKRGKCRAAIRKTQRKSNKMQKENSQHQLGITEMLLYFIYSPTYFSESCVCSHEQHALQVLLAF
ncbi:hypothetical protein LguiA_027041 [Lonicera macranthoides]